MFIGWNIQFWFSIIYELQSLKRATCQYNSCTLHTLNVSHTLCTVADFAIDLLKLREKWTNKYSHELFNDLNRLDKRALTLNELILKRKKCAILCRKKEMNYTV